MHRALGLCSLLVLAACGPAASPSPSAPSTLGTDAPASPAASATPGATTAPSAPAVADAWEVLDEAPFARLEMAAASHDGRIWLAGGLSPLGEALTEVAVFDPASGEWDDGPELPAGVHHAALVSDGERLLLVGGYVGSDFSRPTDLVLVLEDGGDQWSEGPALPESRAAGAAAFDGSRVVYAGGVGPADVVADVLALEDEEWKRLGTMVRAREHLAAASDGAGTVWLLGGRAGSLTSNMATVEVVTGDAVAQLAPLPTARGGVAAFFVEGVGACLTGGEAPDRAFAAVECVDADGAITVLPELNEPHHGHGAAVVDGVAYVLLGGPQPTLSAGSTVESLDLAP